MSVAHDFCPELWRDRLERLGEQIRWLRRLPCPCTNPETREAERDCTRCGGSRYMHEERAITAYRALVTNQMPRELIGQLGQFQIGDVLCQTMPDEIPLSQFDVVIVPGRIEEDAALLVKGSSEALPAWPVVELIVVSDGATEYEVGTDGELAADEKTISWIGAEPDEGATYSVRYRYAPTYDVLEMLPHRRKLVGDVRLPQAVTLRMRTMDRGGAIWQ